MKFTVCVPTVRLATLTNTGQSIIAQTWPDWKLLVIGHCSIPHDDKRIHAPLARPFHTQTSQVDWPLPLLCATLQRRTTARCG